MGGEFQQSWMGRNREGATRPSKSSAEIATNERRKAGHVEQQICATNVRKSEADTVAPKRTSTNIRDRLFGAPNWSRLLNDAT